MEGLVYVHIYIYVGIASMMLAQVALDLQLHH